MAVANLPTVQPPRLPYDKRLVKYEIDISRWRVLTESIFPGAKSPGAILLAVQYCQERGLDVMKKMVHIVPHYDKAKRQWIETVWPAIAELRTTAHRTGKFAGMDRVQYGPMITKTWKDRDGEEVTLEFPEWAQITVYRIVNGQRFAFPGPEVYWEETFAESRGAPNSMWRRRKVGQLQKCAEAAALRAAFPEELGGELSAEEAATIPAHEIAGRVEPAQIVETPAGSQLDGFAGIAPVETQEEIDEEIPRDTSGRADLQGPEGERLPLISATGGVVGTYVPAEWITAYRQGDEGHRARRPVLPRRQQRGRGQAARSRQTPR